MLGTRVSVSTIVRQGWFSAVSGVILAIAVASCSSSCKTKSTSAAAALPSEVVLAPGQEAAIEGTQIRLRFVRVLSDSRCPTDVVCIQAGQAVVLVEVLENATVAARLELRDTGGDADRYSDLSITLVDLTPRPISTRPIDPATYRATLRVELARASPAAVNRRSPRYPWGGETIAGSSYERDAGKKMPMTAATASDSSHPSAHTATARKVLR